MILLPNPPFSSLSPIEGNWLHNLYLFIKGELSSVPIAFVPLITGGGSMIISDVVVNSALKVRSAKNVFIGIDIEFTTSGTPSNNVIISLPYSVNGVLSISGVGNDGSSNYIPLLSFANNEDTNVTVYKADATNFGIGSARRIVLHGGYFSND